LCALNSPSFEVSTCAIYSLSFTSMKRTRTGTKKEVVTSKNGKSRGWNEEQQNSLNHHLIYSFVTFEEPLDLISWTAHKRALRFESKESISFEHISTWHLVEHCYTDVQYNLKSCTIP
jgi:hypothetical protein